MSKIYFGADFHISISVPQARKLTEEEFFQVQVDKLKQVKEIVKDDLLVIAGDIVDTGLPYKSELLINLLVDNLPENTVFISGNHELLGFGHRLDSAMEKGILGNLARTRLKMINESFIYNDFNIIPFHYQKGRTVEHTDNLPKDKINVCVGHFLSFPNELPFWAKDAVTHESIIKEFPEYDYFVIGDNHATDLTEGKYLSPGALVRRTANQIKHKPCIWELTKEGFKPHYLVVEKDAISKEHIIKKNGKDERLSLLAKKFENMNSVSTDFESNLETMYEGNKSCEVYELLKQLINKVRENK